MSICLPIGHGLRILEPFVRIYSWIVARRISKRVCPVEPEILEL